MSADRHMVFKLYGREVWHIAPHYEGGNAFVAACSVRGYKPGLDWHWSYVTVDSLLAGVANRRYCGTCRAARYRPWPVGSNRATAIEIGLDMLLRGMLAIASWSSP